MTSAKICPDQVDQLFSNFDRIRAAAPFDDMKTNVVLDDFREQALHCPTGGGNALESSRASTCPQIVRTRVTSLPFWRTGPIATSP